MSKKVLVVAVHPDDETLGAGGTLLKHSALGDEIYWLIMTNVSEESGWSKEFVAKRQKEIEKVNTKYAFNKVFDLGFTPTKLDTYQLGNIIAKVSKVFNEVKPNIIYLPNNSDVHSDHRISFDAVYSCTKSFRYPFIERILMMEVLSETEFAPSISGQTFVPNTFIDISDYFEKKIDIFKCFDSEVMKNNLPRSISATKALANYRGSRIGVEFAEAFMLLFSNEI